VLYVRSSKKGNRSSEMDFAQECERWRSRARSAGAGSEAQVAAVAFCLPNSLPTAPTTASEAISATIESAVRYDWVLYHRQW
jgi:hypothetical protein